MWTQELFCSCGKSFLAQKQFHMSGKTVLQSGMEYRKQGVSMGLPSLSEFELWRTEERNVRAAREALDRA